MWTSALFVVASLAAQAGKPIQIDGTWCHPNRLLVHVDGPVAQKALLRSGMRVLRSMPQIDWVVVEAPRNQLQLSRRRLNALPGLNAQLDRAAFPAYTPNDPMWPDMWHFVAVKANLAWDLSFGSPVTVAVLDTGVKVDHEDLASNIWINQGEIPNNSIDDDGNGLVDDVNGWDFAYNTANLTDVYGHGTNCAGIVGAVQDNAIGVTGVAPRAKIMVLKVSIDSGYIYDSATVPAYLYAAAKGARVMSMSYFSDRVSQAERDAIDYCWNQGVLPVAAAGNSNSVIPFYPGAYENTLCVGAVNGNINRAGFSNFGSWVDVAAPGVSLATPSNGGGYTTGFGGTSGATPHVAGLATLLFGARPSATAAEVRQAIEDTATTLNQWPFGEYVNYGLINAQAATQAILTTPAPRRSAVVRWISPAAVSVAYAASETTDVYLGRIYGRGFQGPVPVQVTVGGHPVAILGRGRDWIDISLPLFEGTFVVTVDGAVAGTIKMPSYSIVSDEVHEKTVIYTPTDASTQGATLEGGFFDMLNTDPQFVRCTRRGDGVIRMDSILKNVKLVTPRFALFYKRLYTLANPSSTERVYLYDWSSASYPYGSWVQIGSSVLPTTSVGSLLTIPNPGRFIDPEGTMYLRIETTANVAAGTELRVDTLQLRQGVPD